jgi:hypothetical protein
VIASLLLEILWGIEVSVEAGLVGFLQFEVKGYLNIVVLDTCGAIPRSRTHASGVTGEGAQWDTLKEGEFLDKLSVGKLNKGILEVHDAIIVGLLFSKHFFHIGAMAFVNLQVTDIKI